MLSAEFRTLGGPHTVVCKSISENRSLKIYVRSGELSDRLWVILVRNARTTRKEA